MPSVSEFLIERLEKNGVKHVFGVPGDYILTFYKNLDDCPNIEVVNTTDEAHAGFAADAYSRVLGVGCVAVTYNVGALKIANSVACAFAEHSPMIVISGSPGMKERGEDFLLHHTVRNFDCQRAVFQNITCATAVLDNPNNAGYEIDRVLTAMHQYKQPVYIEIPRDIADKSIGYDVYKQGTPSMPISDNQNLAEAIAEVVDWLNVVEKPIILAGVQIARFGLGDELIKFAEKWNIPIATTILSKSVISETHPLFMGVYMGSGSKDHVKQAIEASDCILMFGELLTDMTLSFQPLPPNLKRRNSVSCTLNGLKVKNHSFENVLFKDFCQTLFKKVPTTKKIYVPQVIEKKEFQAQSGKITTTRFFEKVNSILTEDNIVLADIGDSLFGSADLIASYKSSFLGAAFYTSMGTAIPGSLGAQLAKPEKRPIVLVGDGAFQMSCTELSTIVARKLNPIVFVLNNNGYTTERFLIDGSFNDLSNWNYHHVVDMVGGKGLKVETEEELEKAINTALVSKELFVINVVVDKLDITPALKRMTDSLVKKVKDN